MKKNISGLPLYVMMALLATIMVFSCGKKSDGSQSKLDSLENANTLGKLDNDYLRQSIALLAEGLDSINAGEDEIFKGGNPELGGKQLTRQEMKDKLASVRDILARHKNRIAELEKQLAAAKDAGSQEAKNLQTIIYALRSQLELKDKELAQLRADLDDSRKSIKEMTGRMTQMSGRMTQMSGKMTQMNTQMEQMNTQMEEMETVNEEQSRTIEAQEIQMNKAYIKIGTKSELKNLGMLTGGNIFKKSKLDYSNIDLSSFECKDKRQVTTISLPKKYKILTPQPSTSYEVIDGTLRILNADQFWGASNFLIIQIN